MTDRVGLTRWLLRVALVLAAAVLVGWAGDVRFGSGSDAGGKLATAEVMARHLTCDPDVGWWAAEHDPDATLHQLVYTEPHGDQYIQATSLSYQCAVMPFQRVLGPWGPVLVSVLGAIAAALAAARIAGWLGGGETGQIAAFWLVGLVGPAFFYGLDVWEHAPALGMVAWAAALALGPPTARRAFAVGVLGAVAVTFRAEMAVVLASLALAGVSVPDVRRRWLRRPVACIAGVVSAAAVTGGYVLLERALVSGSVRGDRSADLASQAGGHLADRLTTGVLTTFGVFASDERAYLVLGVALCAGLLFQAHRASRGGLGRGGGTEALSAQYGIALVARYAGGLGFVPGALPAAPMAAAGVFAGRRSPDHAWLVRAALLAPPLILLLQWSSNLVAQWGGRYLLASSLLLTAVGCAALGADAVGSDAVGSDAVGSDAAARPRLPMGFAVLIAVSVAMGVLGAAWHVQRSNGVARAVTAVEQGPADEIILSTQVHFAREAGATYGDRRWLVADSLEELARAEAIIADERPSAIVVVTGGEDLALDGATDGYHLVDDGPVDFLGFPLRVTRYQRDGEGSGSAGRRGERLFPHRGAVAR